ncbi:MAG TPA: MotA/TolQ/ExbB proton channel family protein, partial [Bacteroidia bacterium]|nr:MotA/TolQ/ExbB proton channel family protein [Bacteroidia bacterium]
PAMFHFLLQATAPVADTLNKGIVTDVAATPKEEVITLWQMVSQGSWVMIPLALFLLIALFFAIERLVVISKALKVPHNFMDNIRDYLHSGKIDSARELCRAQSTPVTRVIEKGISRLGKPSREISEALELAGKNEISRAEKNLHYLSLVARIAPMLGFVGTIIGVIAIFHAIGLSGDISIKNISNGLYVKMFSSAAGLVVGVIAFLFYHILNAMVDGIAKKIERSSLAFLDLVNEPGK